LPALDRLQVEGALARSNTMLKDKTSSAIIAVSDVERARKFYGDTLGLELDVDSMGDVLTFRTGETKVVVYKSVEAGTNRANALVWDVGDEVDAIARTLKGKGVAFEHYDMPGVKLEGDIHVGGEMRMAWFKDPDGNILHINNM
jgi:catechol 2,3-dioxygenase-like lactoylglutathione lyase family enzyme